MLTAGDLELVPPGWPVILSIILLLWYPRNQQQRAQLLLRMLIHTAKTLSLPGTPDKWCVCACSNLLGNKASATVVSGLAAATQSSLPGLGGEQREYNAPDILPFLRVIEKFN
jgi:hypothetical protein